MKKNLFLTFISMIIGLTIVFSLMPVTLVMASPDNGDTKTSELSYDIPETEWTWSVPASQSFDSTHLTRTSTVSILPVDSSIILPEGSSMSITMNSANEFKLKRGDSAVPYTMSVNGSPAANNSEILSFIVGTTPNTGVSATVTVSTTAANVAQASISGIHTDIITFTINVIKGTSNTFQTTFDTLTAGLTAPDMFVYGDYFYMKDSVVNGTTSGWLVQLASDDLAYMATDAGLTIENFGISAPYAGFAKTTYGPILDSAFNIPVTSMDYTFSNTGCSCRNMTTAPNIPSTVVSMRGTFGGCVSLTGNIEINANPTVYSGCFVDTVAPIVLSGSSSVLAELAATSSGNVTVAGSTPVNTFQTTFNALTSEMSNPGGFIYGDYFYLPYSIYGGGTGWQVVLNTSENYNHYMDDVYPYENVAISDLGLSVTNASSSATSYGQILDYAFGIDVVSLGGTFSYCTAMTTAPTIPSSVTDLHEAFSYCTSLTTAPSIPSGVINMSGTFTNCNNLTAAPSVPDNVTDLSSCFAGCYSITTAPVLPSHVVNLDNAFTSSGITAAPTIPNGVTSMAGTFTACTQMVSATTIPSTVLDMSSTFEECHSLTGTITINATPTSYANCFAGTLESIFLAGSSSNLQALANTSVNNNVVLD